MPGPREREERLGHAVLASCLLITMAIGPALADPVSPSQIRVVDGDTIHHGRGVFEHSVVLHRNGTASLSSTKISPTSRLADFRIAHDRPLLQRDVPSVPAGHEQATYSRSSLPAATSSRRRRAALYPNARP